MTEKDHSQLAEKLIIYSLKYLEMIKNSSELMTNFISPMTNSNKCKYLFSLIPNLLLAHESVFQISKRTASKFSNEKLWLKVEMKRQATATHKNEVQQKKRFSFTEFFSSPVSFEILKLSSREQGKFSPVQSKKLRKYQFKTMH